MHNKILLLVLSFAVLFDFTGCAMSPQARRERAYRHYVQKQIKHRQREMARAQKAANRELKKKLKSIEPSEPRITTSLEDTSSQPVSAPVSATEPAPSFKEPIVDPITVSASDSPQNPDQPSPP